jgi:hypothetical protein
MSPGLRLAIAGVALAAAVGTTATAAAPVPDAAGKNVVLPYPAKAPVVVHVQGVEQARERLGKLLAAAAPDQAAQLNKQIDAGFGQLLAGRKLTAVPKAGRAFVVVHDIAKLVEDEPAVSALLPVTDYKAFRESFLTADEQKSFEKGTAGVDSVKSSATGNETTVYLVDLKDYVALTIDKGTAEVYAAKYARAESSAMGPELAASFLAADVSLFVNVDVINDLYGEQIRQFKTLIDFAFGQAQMGGMIPGLGKKQVEAMKAVFGGIFQGVEDCRGLVAGAEFRPDGLALRLQARVAGDSATGRLLKAETPTPLSDLPSLPRGLTVYAGSKVGKPLTDLMKSLAQQFTASDDDEKGAEAVDKLLTELAAAGPQGEYTASKTPETNLSVAAFKDPAKAAAAEVNLYKSLAAGSRVANVVLKEKPKVTGAAQKDGGITFTEVRLHYDFEATVKDLPDAVKESTLATMKRTAKEKTAVWIGTDGKAVVTVAAADWTAAKKVLDDYRGKAGVGTDPGFKLTRKNLPAEASVLGMAETGELIQAMAEQFKAFGDQIPGFPLQLGAVKPVKGEPTYLGLALTLKPETATVDVFVPGAAMNVGVKMLAPLFRTIE